MLSTIILVTFLLSFLITSVVLWALFLFLGLRWAKVPDVTKRRVFIATATVIVLQCVFNVLFLTASPSSNEEFIFLALVELAISVIVPCLVITRVFKTRFLRALQAWFLTLFASVAIFAFLFLVIRPYLYVAFVSQGNTMAPTMLGSHWRSVCPECGQSNYCSPMDARFVKTNPPLMICENFHTTHHSNVDRHIYSADRILVAKFVEPKRWDLIVFQYPANTSTPYVMRIVGLPGEKIHIEDGAVWANGKKLTPPDSISEIEYLSHLPQSYRSKLWGSIERPAQLGEDEFFVLGEFSARSKDSRLWEQGAPGHNSFAVPKSYIEGVVTHIFWPLHRCRILR